jgi:hypothetical protein
MTDGLSFTVALWLAVIAPISAWLAWDARAIVRRLDRVPTRSVSELAAGPAEVAGTLRAEEEPLRALGGEAAVAIRTRLGCTYKAGRKTQRTLVVVDVVEAVAIVVEDETGSCVLAVDPVLVLGKDRRATYAAATYERMRPDRMQQLREALTSSGEIQTVHVEESWVADGGRGFVAGNAVIDGAEAEAGYRGAHARFRMHGDEASPLLISSWTERAVRRHLAMPSLRLAWVAAASVIVVVAVLVAGRVIAAAAGLE